MLRASWRPKPGATRFRASQAFLFILTVRSANFAGSYETRLHPIILALALAGVAAAVPASWRARYDKLERVYAAKDMAGLSALCAKDLVWVQVDGTKKNRAETLAEFAGMFKSDKVRVHEKLLSVKKNGNTVDVSCEVFAVFSVKGKPDARMHSFCVDSWQKIGGKWQIVKTVDTKVEMTGG